MSEIPALKNNKKDKKLWAVFIACSFAMLFYYLYICRDVVLTSHDSLSEFTFAKMFGWKWAYDYSFKFIVTRGRFSYIFPAVICLRFFVHEYGNFLAVWLLQYVPVYAVVFLISSIISRRVRRDYGVMFGLFFITFLQINVGHSLITCYPLEFMYALFIAILGLDLYWSYLTSTSKFRVIKLIISLILYYESIQAYEAFLITSVGYFILSATYSYSAYLKKKKGFKKASVKLVVNLIPHFIVSVVFLCIFKYLKDHPMYQDVSVIDISDRGTFKGFLKCWFLFSTGMLPLRNFIEEFEGAVKHLLSLKDLPRNIFILLIAGVGSFAGTRLILSHNKDYKKEHIITTNGKLRIIGLIGLAAGVMFPMPHALTRTYQSWIDLGVTSYVPSTICYYGWATFIVCFSCMGLNKISLKKVIPQRIATGIVCFLFSVGSVLTACTNDAYFDMKTSTSPYVSYKAQAFYSLCHSETFDIWEIDCIYTPPNSFIGIHNYIESIEGFMEYEIGGGYDVEIVNTEDFLNEYQSYSNMAELIYDDDARVAYIMPVGVVLINDNGQPVCCTSGQLLIASSHGGEYEVWFGDELIAECEVGNWDYEVVDVLPNVPCEGYDIRLK